MCNDQQTSVGTKRVGCDLFCALKQQLSYHRVIANGLAILPYLAIRSFCDAPIQLKLAGDHCLCEITFANEIRDYANLSSTFRIEQEEPITQTRFLFPESTLDIREDFTAPNLGRMRQRRRTRIRVHRRAVSDD